MRLNLWMDEIATDTYLQGWHKFFALWPRRVGVREFRWLESIERRGVKKPIYIDNHQVNHYWVWEYRTIKTCNSK